jgi:hypothetical protein
MTAMLALADARCVDTYLCWILFGELLQGAFVTTLSSCIYTTFCQLAHQLADSVEDIMDLNQITFRTLLNHLYNF